MGNIRSTSGLDTYMRHSISALISVCCLAFSVGCSSTQSNEDARQAIRENRVYVADLLPRDMIGNDILNLLNQMYATEDISYGMSREGMISQIWVAEADAQAALTYLETHAPPNVVVGFLGWPNHPLDLKSIASSDDSSVTPGQQSDATVRIPTRGELHLRGTQIVPEAGSGTRD